MKPAGRRNPTAPRRVPAMPAVIDTDDALARGVATLRRRCALMREIHAISGDPPLRRYPAGFAGLARIVVGQQVSLASAEAIWARTVAAVRPLEATTVLRCDDATLRAAGLSSGKVLTLRALARAIESGAIEPGRLAAAPEEEVREQLVAVRGIGPWTVDIFLIFSAGRADAWAPGDLALQIAAQRMLGRAERLGASELEDLAERWRPLRSVAARLLWAYYAAIRTRRA